MTVATIWEESGLLWAVADTRFSVRGETTPWQPVTEHGVKLFPLSIIVRAPGTNGFFDAVALQTTIGFMYAGENGPAFATYAFCSSVLQNLVVTNGDMPRFADISNFIARSAERFMRDWGSRWREHWRFEAFVFGWCARCSLLQTYKLQPRTSDGLAVQVERIDTGTPAVIGSGAPAFREQLRLLQQGGDTFGRTARLPLLAVEQLVANEVQDDVGGDIQIGTVDRNGLRIATRVRPEVAGQSSAKITFLGIDTLDLGSIGSCDIGFRGIA